MHPLWAPIWTTRASCGQGRPDQAGPRDPATPESSSHPTPPHTDVPPSLTVVSTCQSSGTPHPPPAAPGRASPTTPVDRRVTQPPTPPSLGSHTHSLALEKVFFFFFFKHSCSVLGCFSHGVPGPGQPSIPFWDSILSSHWVAWPYCVWSRVGERWAPGGPRWPPIILAPIKSKHIAHLLHNKPQLFHGLN